MARSAPDIRLVPPPDDERLPASGPQGVDLAVEDLEAARELAEVHRTLAAELPPHSPLRGLILRCGGHWSRLGAIPRNGLAGVKRLD